jgi:putative membrane protein
MMDDQAHVPKSNTTTLGVVLRGVLMGLAEVVPGVSGGTMAFITGIYQELVASLATFGPRSLGLVTKPMDFYRQHNLGFLFALGMGMVVGIVLFAQLMRFLLANYQPLVWAFFSGVIVMSAIAIGWARKIQSMALFGPIGLLLGLSLLWLPTAAGDANLLQFFLGGAVAVCAWLLPAISGSFVLLTLGLYNPLIEALATLDLTILAAVAGGCAVGLLLFAKLLSWLLHRYSEPLFSLLVGFMLGSLPKLWPWQDPTQSQVLAKLLLPVDYVEVVNAPAYGVGVAVTFVSGLVVLWCLTKLANHE